MTSEGRKASADRLTARLTDERGVALIVALMATMLLTALGMSLVLMSNTETMISANYRNSQEALYAADAAVERVVQDLLMIPRWNDILAADPSHAELAGVRSAFIDTNDSFTRPLPAANQTLNLLQATDTLQSGTDNLNLWGSNNPSWRLFAHAPLSSVLANSSLDTNMYVAVWVADDPAEVDDNPSSDSNGTLTLHAEAFGPMGTRKVIEVTVARTSSTEIERGQIAQRGQDELNQRARKAAVQTPGKSLTNMSLDVASGGLR